MSWQQQEKMNDLISAVKSKQFVENELAAFHKFRQDLPATLSYFHTRVQRVIN
jgi:hypothetical protein